MRVFYWKDKFELKLEDINLTTALITSEQNLKMWKIQNSHTEVSCKKGVLKSFLKVTEKQLCQSLFFNKVAGFRPATLLKKETLAQVYSCEFWQIVKKTFFIKHLQWLLLKIMDNFPKQLIAYNENPVLK